MHIDVVIASGVVGDGAIQDIPVATQAGNVAHDKGPDGLNPELRCH